MYIGGLLICGMVGFILFVLLNQTSPVATIGLLTILGTAASVAAVYLAFRLSLAGYCLLDAGIAATAGIRESWAATKGKVGYIFGQHLRALVWLLPPLLITIAAATILVINSLGFKDVESFVSNLSGNPGFWAALAIFVVLFLPYFFVYGLVFRLFQAKLYLSLRADNANEAIKADNA